MLLFGLENFRLACTRTVKKLSVTAVRDVRLENHLMVFVMKRNGWGIRPLPLPVPQERGRAIASKRKKRKIIANQIAERNFAGPSENDSVPG